MPSLPLPIGACLTPGEIAAHRDWLLSAPRDLELQGFHMAETLLGDWTPLAEEARRALDGMTGRIGIHGPFWGFTLDSHDPEVRAIATRRMMAGLDVCAAVGATQMVIHSPYTTWDHNNLDNRAGDRDKLVERVHETLRAPVARADSEGVTLVIENIQDVDPGARVALARSFGTEAVKVSIDTGHAAYAHGATGAPPVDYYVKIAGDMLHHVHLQDADGYADRHWQIGRGSVPWAAVFAALAEVTSQPRLVLELRRKDEIPASFAYLRDLGLAQ